MPLSSSRGTEPDSYDLAAIMNLILTEPAPPGRRATGEEAARAYSVACARLADSRERFAALAGTVAELARVLGEMQNPGSDPRTILVHEWSSGASGPTSSHSWPTVRDVNGAWAELFRAGAAVRQAWSAIPPDDRAGLTPPDLPVEPAGR